jgi:hypothetical protein
MATQIVTTIIAGIFALLGGVIREIVKYNLEKREREKAQSLQLASSPISHAPHWRTPALWALTGIIAGYVIGFFLAMLKPTPPPPPIPTPIPRGELLMEINFDQPGDGDCNRYNDALLGYENRQYYILPKPNGYIAICHDQDDLESQGSLEVVAWTDQEIRDVYGFALLFGWQGGGDKTTDACIVGIQRQGEVTRAFYEIRQAGVRKADTTDLTSFTLDNARHNLRVVLYPDGSAYGYLDERLFGVYRFAQCGPGPVGMLAWGPGGQKIYFDDLKLYTLP